MVLFGENGVRSGNDSVEVLLLKLKDGKVMDAGENAWCAAGCLPDIETGNAFMQQMIRLPGRIVPWGELEKMKVATGFGNEVPWKYKNILLLDEESSYVVSRGKANRTYCYSRETGLIEKTHND